MSDTASRLESIRDRLAALEAVLDGAQQTEAIERLRALVADLQDVITDLQLAPALRAEEQAEAAGRREVSALRHPKPEHGPGGSPYHSRWNRSGPLALLELRLRGVARG
jgi:hypothetical protein